MSILTSVKLELLKLRHTKFWLFHILIICGITLLMDVYYILYDFKEPAARIKMIYEFVGILLPIFCSISIAFLIRIEEGISNMYGILGVRHRKTVIMGIWLVAWSIAVLQLLLQTVSIKIIGGINGDILQKLWLLCGGMMVFSSFYYLFHLFLHLKFGIGLSILWGVFECMQSVMYSNIELAKIFRYIPFAWLMEWKDYVLEGEWKEEMTFWAISFVLLLIYFCLFLRWFERWEEKKKS